MNPPLWIKHVRLNLDQRSRGVSLLHGGRGYLTPGELPGDRSHRLGSIFERHLFVYAVTRISRETKRDSRKIQEINTYWFCRFGYE